MAKPVALVTGAGGEMGSLLMPALVDHGFDVVALDKAALAAASRELCIDSAELDILDRDGLRRLFRRHPITTVFHLAAILSSHAERNPALAHRVNVEGTLELYRLCIEEPPQPLRFLFPSSIAVYGLPSAAVKAEQGMLKEWQWTAPTGMYGCNKLYCELVGAYHARRSTGGGEPALDFRSIRFPGLISADTLPTGGTTDFAPEMIHAAAEGRPYACFVREDSRLPFMTMPDAIDALLALALTERERISPRAYNIRGFSCTAGQIRDAALRYFPGARVEFAPVEAKQAIVDSWPEDVDDSRARRDWGLDPRHGMREALDAYLVPALERRYGKTAQR